MVCVVRPGSVTDAGLEGELLELLAAAIVEDVDVQLVDRPIHIECAERGVAHYVEGLVKRGDEHVDVGPIGGIFRQRHRSPAQRPDGLKVPKKENDEGVGLGKQQTQNEKDVQRTPVVGGVVKKTCDLRDAPVSVTEGTEHGEHHEGNCDQVGVGTARHGQSHYKAHKAQHRLLLPGERHDCEEAENDRGQNEK